MLPESSVIVSDSGELSNSVSPVLQSKGPWIESSSVAKSTSLAGYAIGTKLGKKESAVIAIVDSANCSYSISEVITCATHNIPLITVIGNNNSTGKLVANDPSSNSPYASFEAAVDSAGGKSLLVDGKDVKTLKVTLEKAISSLNEGSNVLVNLKV